MRLHISAAALSVLFAISPPPSPYAIPVGLSTLHLDANHDGWLSESDLPLLSPIDRETLLMILRRKRVTTGSFG